MSFANVQFSFYRAILYFLTFWNCESNTFRSSNVWPRLQILWWEFVWKEEFSRWLRCRLSFGPRPPLTNLKFPRLFSANHPPLSFGHVPPWWLVLWFTRWLPSKKIQKGDLFTTLSTQKVISKFRPCRPTFAHRYSQQMAPTSAARRLNHNSTIVSIEYFTVLAGWFYLLEVLICPVVMCADWTTRRSLYFTFPLSLVFSLWVWVSLSLSISFLQPT